MRDPTIRRRLIRVFAGLLITIALSSPAPAQGPPQAPALPPAEASPPQPQPAPTLPSDVADAIGRLAGAIDTAEKAIQHLTELEEELGRLRIDVESILTDSQDTAETLRPKLVAIKSQIERLGPAPGRDGPAESPAIAAERARLTVLASAYDGAIKSTELTWVRARQLIEKITVLRHSLFAKNLMERLPSPLLPSLWRDLVAESPVVGSRVRYLAQDWSYWANAKGLEVAGLLAATLLLYLILKYAVARFTDRRKLRAEAAPSFFERARSVAWVAPLRALPAIGATLLLYVGLDSLDLLYAPWGRTAAAVVKGVFLYSAVSALVKAVLAPDEPQWRLVSLADGPTRKIGRLLYAITAVYALDAALTDVNRAFLVPLAVSVVQTFAASLAFAVLLIGILLTPFAPTGATVSTHSPRWLKLPLWVAVLGILALALFGYVALARFVAQQLVMTGIVLVVWWLLYLAIRAVTREPQQRRYPVGEMLEARFGLDAPRRDQLARLTELALTFALTICAIPVLMLQWGFSGADIRDRFTSLFFGLEVGQFRISLARILFGIVLFIALLFATRLFQGWLRDKAVQQTRMDPGIANSIDTVVGYAGTALAALLAISYAGLDITNIAIVAGALSVGIGFGLQSIVNNFVSGLILLIERPIKVGDRIVVGDQQGHVRRISVRATEIETFDRASLIVPNAELITGRVLNWTHRDSLGAVNVKVGVGYNSDPDQVIAILKKCADDHPQVLRTPAPSVVFEDFGDSTLKFNLRISLPDIDKAAGVQSDLRVAIFKALGAAGIEIPFNQVDVNLRDLDGIKRYVSQYLQERAAKPSEPAQPNAGNGNGKRVGGQGS
jgi:potassium-dependent mechanosensitive channel